MKSLPVGLLGAGRMGQLHGRVYSQMPDVQLVGVFDTDPAAAQALARKHQTQFMPDLDTLASQVQAVSIASPTQTHLQIAEVFLRRGIPVLIEKPLAADSAQARRILDLAEQNSTFVQVGHSERFNPAIRALEAYTIQPRFIEAVRFSPFPFRSMDIGAVLDLMIHDLDLVLHLVGSEPTSIDADGAAVLGNHEDLADVRMKFPDGCVAKLSCSRIALDTQRTLRIFSDNAYISLDLHKKTGFVVEKSENIAKVKQAIDKFCTGQTPGPAPKWTDLVQSRPIEITEAEPMRLQLENFVHCVRTGDEPIVTGRDGLAAITTAERILQNIKSNL